MDRAEGIAMKADQDMPQDIAAFDRALTDRAVPNRAVPNWAVTDRTKGMTRWCVSSRASIPSR